MFVHKFWNNYLHTKSNEQIQTALDFCYDFGRSSQRLESFFKGFVYFLALRHVRDRDHLGDEFQGWSDDFDFFVSLLKEQNFKSGS